MKMEHYEYVYQQFEPHLKHYWHNKRYGWWFSRETTNTLRIELSIWKDCYCIVGERFKLFDQIRCYDVADEILRYIKETEVLFA